MYGMTLYVGLGIPISITNENCGIRSNTSSHSLKAAESKIRNSVNEAAEARSLHERLDAHADLGEYL